MKWVIVRDDDTNALTPADYLERLYRPFLDHGLPVNLAVIPNVRTDVTYGAGIPEGFLVAKNGYSKKFAPLAENDSLVQYLRANSGYALAQHGCHHEFVRGQCEFDQDDRLDLMRRLAEGLQRLKEAGFERPAAFIAPYDRLTRTGYREVAKHFPVISIGWFELGRLPLRWWPAYLRKKILRRCHWRVGQTLLLSHPGCHLSYHRPLETMLEQIKKSIAERNLTVLVTHWWEFFPNNRPNEAFIAVLHATAEYLAAEPNLNVITFRELASGKVRI